MAGFASEDPLFREGQLDEWLEARLRMAIEHANGLPAGEALRRPPEQVAEELIDRFELGLPTLRTEDANADVSEVQVDISQDQRRFIEDRSRPFYVAGTRIALFVPYEDPRQF